MKNLLIGNTSQIAHYIPDENFVKISSRNLDIKYLRSNNWNKIIICIGESRKFINDIKIYDDINFYHTMEIINNLKNVCRNIVVFSTCELWNQYDGKIDLSLTPNFFSTPYLQSKYKLSKFILNNKDEYNNVFILYPFNFNSVYRNSNFLFGKVFDSIINKKVIEIGDTYFYRDIVHPKYVSEKAINATHHEIIGSGRLTFVNDFIRDIYYNFGLLYEDYVIENTTKFLEYDKRKEYYLKSNKNLYSYKQLLEDTIQDLNNFIKW